MSKKDHKKGGKAFPPLSETVARTEKEYEAPKGLTLQYCTLEIYEASEDYKSGKGIDIINKIKTLADEKKYSYSIIFHDNDFYTENTFDSYKRLIGTKGQKKANHYHVVIGFRYRVQLSDVAIWFDIPDKFIEKLKGEKDYDNLLTYLTHVKYDEKIKTHYSVDSIDSNIKDYCVFLYDQAVKSIEENQNNIINYLMETLSNYPKRISYAETILILENEYNIGDILKYFRIIEKLVFEHNTEKQIADDVEKAIDYARAVETRCSDQIIKEREATLNDLYDEVSVTGCKVTKHNDKEYITYEVNERQK